MPEFTISVIIPSFNRTELIGRALDSVSAQSCQADEIIVIDDGSSDDTVLRIRQQYPDVNLIIQQNRGVSAARNTGIQQARGNWICLLDSDDSWQPDKLEKQLQALTHQPGYRLCHTNETWFRHGKLLRQKKKHEKKGGHIFQDCLPLCVISPSSVMLEKRLFDEVGLFDESLPACEDYDMWLRICHRYPVLFIDEPLTNKFGGHRDQLSQQHWGMDRFRIIALQKCIESASLNDIDHQAAIGMLLEKIDIFLKGAAKHGGNTYTEQFVAIKKQYA